MIVTEVCITTFKGVLVMTPETMGNPVLVVDGSVVLLIAGVAMAFVVSFFCSLMEAALLSMTPGQLAELARRKPGIGAVMRQLKEDIERPITAILTLNTAAHTVGATIAGAEFALIFGDGTIGLFSGLFTYVMLQYTEILPKSLGVRFNARIAERIGLPLSVLTTIMAPLIHLLRFINRPFERGMTKRATTVSMDELLALTAHAQLARLISPRQETIITRAAQLSRLKAKDVMVGVEQITFLSSTQTLAEAIVTAHLDPHTRFPVIEAGDKDRVLGYVNFKELVYRVRTNPVEPTLLGVIRPLRLVQVTTPCQECLKAFVDEHEHMAIVQDKQKKTVGLITLEDLIEELLGDLEDEFDRVPKMLHALSKGVWIAGGGVLMRDLARELQMPALARDGTVSEWVIAALGHTPAVDERLREGQFEFTVRRLRRSKVFEVLISPISVPSPSVGEIKDEE